MQNGEVAQTTTAAAAAATITVTAGTTTTLLLLQLLRLRLRLPHHHFCCPLFLHLLYAAVTATSVVIYCHSCGCYFCFCAFLCSASAALDDNFDHWTTATARPEASMPRRSSTARSLGASAQRMPFCGCRVAFSSSVGASASLQARGVFV